MVLDIDGIQTIDRVVCDRHNVPSHRLATICRSDFARSEGQAPTGDAEVNKAYDLSGGVATFYDQIGGIDLTEG